MRLKNFLKAISFLLIVLLTRASSADSASVTENFTTPQTCPVIDQVPDDAEFVRTHGIDLAIFPHKHLPHPFSGCQYVWIGDADEPKSMVKFSVAYFEDHHVRWFVGQEPREDPFKCIYRNGNLVQGESEKAKNCPTAEALENL